ncbi:MAG: TIGR02444 family protein [bacterium]
MSKSDNPLWDYAVALYQQPGVKEECLTFQNRFGGNVNLLLFGCWLDQQGVTPSAEQLKYLVAEVDKIDSNLVQPIRLVRLELGVLRDKHANPEVLEAYQSAKEAELEAERLVIDDLFRYYGDNLASKAKQTTTSAVYQYASSYCDVDAALTSLLEAASNVDPHPVNQTRIA